MKSPAELAADWALITELGGPAEVAAKLEWTKEGSVQRVRNWKVRGIPSKVQVAYPHLFLPQLQQRKQRARA